MTCLECEREFNAKHTDTYDERFCSKWCEKKYCDREYGKSVEVGAVMMGDTLSAKRRAGDVLAITDGAGSEANIARDSVMMRHIMSGNASDKGLKRDVTAMNKEISERARQEKREMQKGRVDEARARYRAKWGNAFLALLLLLYSGCSKTVVYKCPEGQVAIREDEGMETEAVRCYTPGVRYYDMRPVSTKKIKHWK